MYCGHTDRLEVDHIYPVYKGGDGSLSNLTIACYKCNASKGIFDLDVWACKLDIKRTEIRQKTISYINRIKKGNKRKTISTYDNEWLKNKIEIHKSLHTYYSKVINSIRFKKYIING